MYTWDIERINSNLQNTFNRFPQNYYTALKMYTEAVDCFIYNNNNSTGDLYFKDSDFLDMAKLGAKAIQDLGIQNMPLFKKFLKEEEIDTNLANNEINHNYDYEEVIDVVRSFLYDINYDLGYEFDELIYDERIALNKRDNNFAKIIPDRLNNYMAIGVNSVNKESMMFMLTHEFGHIYSHLKNNNCFLETLPILLELYLNKYIKKEYPNLNTLPMVQHRFLTSRNIDLDSIKTIYRTYNNNNPDFIVKEFEGLLNRQDNIGYFELSLSYLTSSYKAIDIDSKTKDRYKEIRKLLMQEKHITTTDKLLKSANNRTIVSSNNTNKIKELVRN